MSKRTRIPPSMRPWRAVVLAVDPGSKRSGWSLWAGNLYHRSGECRLTISAVAEVVRSAQALEADLGMPCVLVTERPFMQQSGRAHGASDHSHKLWRDVWESCGGVKKRVVRFYPSEWRSRVLPRGSAGLPREKVRPVEQAAALRLVVNYGYRPAPAGLQLGADESPAICIGRCGVFAGEVGACLPAKLRRCA